jgi:hypothetical protein
MSRSSHLSLSIPLLALLTGCSSSVKMSDADRFGTVWSSVWLSEEDSDDAQSVVLSNVTGVCRKMQKAAEETKDLYDEIEDEYDDLDYDDEDEICEFYADMFGRYAKLYEPLYPKNAHYVSMVFRDEDGRAELDEGTWESDRSADERVNMSIAYFGAGSPWQLLADVIDCDNDDWYDDYEDAYDDFEDEYQTWRFDDDGEVEVTNVRNDRKVKGTFEGGLLDDDGDDDGEIKGSFGASWCEVEDSDYLYTL